jgi:hypothetical protein
MPWRPLDTGLILDDNDVNNDDVGNNDVDKKMPLGGCRPRWWLGRSLLSGVGSGRSRLRVRRLKSVGASVSMASVLVAAHRARIASLRPSPVQRTPRSEPGLQRTGLAANRACSEPGLQRTGLAGNLAGLMCTDESDMRLRCGPNHTNQEFFTDHAALQ